MRPHRAVLLWLLLLGTGCGAARTVHLRTGSGDPIVHTPRDAHAAVELDEAEFRDAITHLARDVRLSARPLQEARRLFGVPARSGTFLFDARSRQILPLEPGDDEPRGIHLLEEPADGGLTRSYKAWCARKHQLGDCLRLLGEGPLLGGDGRYSLAMAIAMDSVWDETAAALEGMVDPEAVLATVTASITMYMLLWALPEPISKGLAALITATAIAYLGVDTVWRILDGWVELTRRVDRSTTFDELREAGEQYGEALGQNAARILVMVATAAIGNTAGLASKAPGLPGSSQAALVVEAQAGYQYAGIASVRSVTLSAEGFTLALAPNALAMAAPPPGGNTQKHHIGTIANEVSTARGGPWTPRLRELFKRAGMELKDPENIVEVAGHKGPHPQEYHQRVFDVLETAMRGCRSVNQCQAALESALRKLAKDIATPGTELNRLVTGH
ncbi:AHH domain-containing protein [Myxococcaceae bacterium GXIMD 01537]